MSKSRKLSRREFLTMAGVAASAAALGSCKPEVTTVQVTATPTPAPPSPTPVPAAAVNIPELIRVEAGSFEMGNAQGPRDERPAHTVSITRSFYIAKHLVTFQQYDAFCAETGKPLLDDYGWGREVLPAFGMNWYDAIAYCDWLSEREGLTPCHSYTRRRMYLHPERGGYRLPTEAEWEYAARGGPISHGYVYAGSDNPDEVAWYRDNADGQVRPVGQKAPNELGLYDMSGNVWELCWDMYAWNYYIFLTPTDDPLGADPPAHPNRSRRGGTYMSEPDELRTTHRGYDPPVRAGTNGIRLVKTAPVLLHR